MKKKKKRARGRPPLPPHIRRDRPLVMMLTEAEKHLFARLAAVDGVSLSEWSRRAAHRQADNTSA